MGRRGGKGGGGEGGSDTQRVVLRSVYSGTGLFECISEPNFRSPFAYMCSKPGVSFNTSMWMDHTNKP